MSSIENQPTYVTPQRARAEGRWIFNPRWDKKMKHIKGEKRQGRL